MINMLNCNNMEDLLLNQLITHYNLPDMVIESWYKKTNEKYFEIEDSSAGELVLHTTRNIGMAKFSNPNKINLTILNYDKFITKVESEPFKHCRKRCDIIVYCNQSFILGELKDRKDKSKVRSGAKKQLISSLETIISVHDIKSFIDSKNVKRCCYFNKQSSSPTSLNATIAFNRLSSIYPDGFKMRCPKIETLGFEFYEYKGEQTLILDS